MGKLVLFLEDGRTQPVALAQERVVIGRRADNDVCLPYPAVSSEHAVIVTILEDSFLEDLGSTNGTLVNGKPVTKHFLRDRDEIEIGRQRLVYVADEQTKVEAQTVEEARDRARTFGEQVERIEPSLRERRAPVPGKPPLSGERRGSAAFSQGNAAGPGVNPPGAAPARPNPGLPSGAPMASGAAGGQVDTFVEELARMTRSAPVGAPANRNLQARINVLSGPNAGRSVNVGKEDVAVGRVGLGVAVLRRTPDGYRLLPAEGEVPPTVAGTAVPAGGALLRGGETFEVAGTRLEFLAPLRPLAG